MWQWDVDQDAFGFGDAVTHGKVGEQAVETGWNGVQSKIGQPAFCVIESLTD